ncbi:ORF137 [Staphylococcus phage 55]|uniref:ORF137 n=1 Tax=Staphylococcus phage 55 TaxID=2936817 RepID=Q4ZB88_9CAUD|nr:ORF137 [Staphylococcus phage 55]EEV66344.1 phage protein [Staphylococcus aureus A9719]EEV69443.1 conserved hypothetical protein [Staphylococcus aureus A9635]EEV79539.1 conserved hypothetical protein [Staphylococcus aureus A6224]EFB56186.1 conserved hypothetical protein [Staphylococcus aureus subsp. aureus WBG10049]EFD98285.1 conserved hypothetical protein [Staphylococcus aureus subsp. aureus M1015]
MPLALNKTDNMLYYVANISATCYAPPHKLTPIQEHRALSLVSNVI